MITVWSTAILAALFGCLAFNDLRTQQVGLVFVTFRRKDSPFQFWSLVSVEVALTALLTFVAMFAYLNPADCDDKGICTVTIRVSQP